MTINATFIGQIIVFLILLWVIAKYVTPAMAAEIDARNRKIADGLAAAEKGQKDLADATTRADAMGPGGRADTPAFNALAGSGRLFRQAYATVPETLPSHTAMLSGRYPAGHGVHENARFVPASTPLVAEALKQAGYFARPR